jgi:hypothetical protein
MKKAYSKPEIMFEDFSLSTNVAAGCEMKIHNSVEGTCAYFGSGGVVVFTDKLTACVYTPGEMGGTNPDEWDGFCYHVPTDKNNLFNS